VREIKFVRIGPIPSHQQPPCEPCLYAVKAAAGGRLRKLARDDIQIPIQRLL
jgi:hypothetical protein